MRTCYWNGYKRGWQGEREVGRGRGRGEREKSKVTTNLKILVVLSNWKNGFS